MSFPEPLGCCAPRHDIRLALAVEAMLADKISGGVRHDSRTPVAAQLRHPEEGARGVSPVTFRATLTNGFNLSSVQDKRALARLKPWESSISIRTACKTMPDLQSDDMDDFVSDIIRLAIIADKTGRDILEGTMLADYVFLDGDHLTNDA